MDELQQLVADAETFKRAADAIRRRRRRRTFVNEGAARSLERFARDLLDQAKDLIGQPRD